MGKGRKPIAPEVHKQTGAYDRNPQRQNRAAPIADGKAPVMPNYFTEDEQTKWKELVADLSAMGVISSQCRELLISYCTAYGGWMKARRKVAEIGMVLPDMKRNPYSVELHKYRQEMDRLLPEFGLTPSARGKLVSLRPEGEENPFQELVGRLASIN